VLLAFETISVDFRRKIAPCYDGYQVSREKWPRESVGFVSGSLVAVFKVVVFARLSGVSPFYAESEDEMWTNIKSVRYDVHLLYHNVTKYALKFLYQTLRRNPK